MDETRKALIEDRDHHRRLARSAVKAANGALVEEAQVHTLEAITHSILALDRTVELWAKQVKP